GRYAERVHHGFLLAGLAWTLTLGAGWGGWLWWQIGTQADFEGVPAAYVVAHGEAQLWGFIVLFVMGISLRTVLQAAARLPAGTWVCRGLLALACAGVAGSVLWSIFPERLAGVGVVSAVLLLVLSAGYWMLQVMLLRSKRSTTWAR